MAIALILIALAIILLGTGGAVFALALFKRSRRTAVPVQQTRILPGTESVFRWKYIALPLIVVGLSAILTAIFYSRLPAEVAWLFNLDGTPDSYLSRELVIVVLLGPQVVLALLAAGLTWSLGRMSRFLGRQANAAVEISSVMLVMGNIMALPQLVLCFAMLDIFSYNAYAVHLLPLWAFALIVMVVGGIMLGIFFMRAMMRIATNRRKTT